MKRIIICCVLLAGCVSASLFSSQKAQRSYHDVTAKIEALAPAMQSGDTQTLALRASELAMLWEREEDVLAHFVRHSHLDAITASMSRLASLAAYGDMGGFSAELAVIRRLMEHIAASENIALDNLF